jgi:anthranilate phosphoribosyltransferase
LEFFPIKMQEAINVFSTLLDKLKQGTDLSPHEVKASAQALGSTTIDAECKKAFLLALSQKGESVEEITAFALAFRDLARNPAVEEFSSRAIDVCGTGGDHCGTFNISTLVSFILAASGIPVFKHGNRSISSQCGSADLLNIAGIHLEVSHEKMIESLRQLNFCFFFAPSFHPAFKEIIPVRKALAAQGKRTIFNILGPLINPGRPAYQLLGVFSDRWTQSLAACLTGLGLKRGLVVHGILADGKGMDELTCAGTNRVVGLGEISEVNSLWEPKYFGLGHCRLKDLAGGSAQENLASLHLIMKGKCNKGLLDTVIFNAGAALWIAEKTNDLPEGISLAKDILLGGTVQNWLDNAREFYSSS